MDQKLLGYARLARPANLPTAAADILAGIAVSGVVSSTDIGSFSKAVSGLDIFYLRFENIHKKNFGVSLKDIFKFYSVFCQIKRICK